MKGEMVGMFRAGQRVVYYTKGQMPEAGRIVKLHRSCRFGVAEIRPEGGGRKLARRLQHVQAACPMVAAS